MSRLPPPLPWPGGARAAASFTFDLDAESGLLWEQPDVAARASVITHQSYGPLVGLPRLLDMLERHRVRSTFFVPGWTAERYPGAVRDVVAAGHEIGHHGYLHEQPSALTAAEEATALDRGLEALEAVAGVRPVGYRAPMWDASWRTARLLAERGFLYDSSLMDADTPYELAVPVGGGDDDGRPPTSSSSIVEIPIHWALDDWERYAYLPGLVGSGLIEAPAVARAVWEAELDGLRAAGGCWVLTCHPFLSGRPGRALELERLLERVIGMDDVWLAPLEEIARHVRVLGLPPRTLTPPQV
ncbi:Polysaccharide deacetylase [Quadrisphaera granulorum]|uniref:Polysaccharide deacetylase n=1 Tax=Quadrisphaera granulorum TaxID=317664 RepID=A0A315ZSY0_9ACTN|nr:polysaccharide deacetylase [Quadrisphaera granulorum]PWJ48666.1 polysaccharide deacetylase [Quadrisphaera granulorum]SZE98388.1 Polysaccharide deacetylase [Quadrisphaera granulorum]